MEWVTERLRLVPVSRQRAGELWRLHLDGSIAPWYWGRWTVQQVLEQVDRMERGWRADGVGKWLAYDQRTGELIGRGGLSRAVVEGASCIEVGWALRGRFWGRGYAAEIGRAGLAFARERLGVDDVVAFTEPHNLRSQAVMRRLGMHYVRDIVHMNAPMVLFS